MLLTFRSKKKSLMGKHAKTWVVDEYGYLLFKGTVMQIGKALINDCLRVTKVS